MTMNISAKVHIIIAFLRALFGEERRVKAPTEYKICPTIDLNFCDFRIFRFVKLRIWHACAFEVCIFRIPKLF